MTPHHCPIPRSRPNSPADPIFPVKEFVCEFCARHLDTTPRVDIVLKPQPSIKLSGCTYFRTLVNSHGIQVRLNETVYVERLINDKVIGKGGEGTDQRQK